uniref:Proteasome activator PA28 C-terminal domain-containing protein n=1 Tax=Monodon monoceros TaxID=40151 RepID=A0A8C6AWF0_MONMO
MASPLKLEQDVQGKVDSFRARIAQEAEDLSGSFIKVLAMPGGERQLLRSNQHLVELIQHVKPEIELLREKCNTLWMWVQLLLPKAEDGNNFGVSIQEDTADQLWTVESTAASYLRRFSTYYNTQAKLVSKIVKYPQVEDYCLTVAEVDENEYQSMCQIRLHEWNQYATLHDVILKNIEKIRTPWSTNTDNLYRGPFSTPLSFRSWLSCSGS